MRDYSKVSSKLWSGKTGRAIRGDHLLQVLASYLLTNEHANMLGLYRLPIAYIAADIGSPYEGALEGVQRLVDLGFCQYDKESEYVWVVNMARDQVLKDGEPLRDGDNRIVGIQRMYDDLDENPFISMFYDKYVDSFKMSFRRLTSPFEAPLKPLSSPSKAIEHEHEQEQEKEHFPRTREPAREAKQRKTKVAENEPEPPDGLSQEAWTLFDEHRRLKSAKDWTSRAKKLAMEKLALYPDDEQMRAVKDAIIGNYTSVYPKGRPRTSSIVTSIHGYHSDESIDQRAERIARQRAERMATQSESGVAADGQ